MLVTEGPLSNGMYVGPVRRRLSADDFFFYAGNFQRAFLCKMSVVALERDGDAGGSENGTDLSEDDQTRYECMFQDCTATFSSLKRHEAHYETSHRNRCSACGRSFPTNRLLDLHLSEVHDSFFKAMAERRAMYVCLVEGCLQVFSSSGKRHGHLVQVHRYPESFDFSRSSYTRKKSGTRERKGGRSSLDRKNADKSNHRNRPQRKPRGCEKPREDGKSAPGAPPTAETTGLGIVKATEIIGDDGRERLRAVAAADSITNSNRKQLSASGLDSATTLEDGGRSISIEINRMDIEAVTESSAVVIRRPVLGLDAIDAPGSLGREKSAPQLASPPLGPRKQAPRACKFWRTARGCRSGSGCAFRHDADSKGSGFSDIKWDATATKCSASTPEACGRNTGEHSGQGGGSRGEGERGGVSVEGVGDDAMDISEVDELINGMKKLLVPRQLSFGRSARRGKPMGKMSKSSTQR